MAKYDVKINNIMRFIRGEEDEFLIKPEEAPKKPPKKRKVTKRKKKSAESKKKQNPKKLVDGSVWLEKRKSAIIKDFSRKEVVLVRNRNLLAKSKRKYDREKLYYDLKRQAILKEWYRLKSNILILGDERNRLNKNLEKISSLEKTIDKNQKQLDLCKEKINNFDACTKKNNLTRIEQTLNIIERSDFKYAEDERRFWLEDTRSVGKEDTPQVLKEAKEQARGIFKCGKCKQLNFEDILVTEIKNGEDIPSYGLKKLSKKNTRRYLQFFDKNGYILTPVKESLRLGLIVPKRLVELDEYFISILLLRQNELPVEEVLSSTVPQIREALNDISADELINYHRYNNRKVQEIENYHDNATVLRIFNQQVKLVSKNQTLEKNARIILVATIENILKERNYRYNLQNKLYAFLKAQTPENRLKFLDKLIISQSLDTAYDNYKNTESETNNKDNNNSDNLVDNKDENKDNGETASKTNNETENEYGNKDGNATDIKINND